VPVQFNPGDSAFTVEGQAVTFIAKVDDGYCVRPVFEDEDGQPYEDGTPIVVRHIYSTPPTERLNQEVLKLNEQIAAKREELAGLQLGIKLTQKSIEQRVASIKRHEGLGLLEDFLEGRITHFVSKNYGPPVIQEFKKALETPDEDRYARVRPLRLLSLFGKTNGDLAWGLNRYSDGSGDHSDVYPCLSLDDAKAKARELMAAEFKEALEKNRGLSYWDRYQAAATAADMEIPADIKALNLREVIHNAQVNLGKAETDCQAWRARLQAASSSLAALNVPE